MAISRLFTFIKSTEFDMNKIRTASLKYNTCAFPTHNQPQSIFM